jgi:hypothetical protein
VTAAVSLEEPATISTSMTRESSFLAAHHPDRAKATLGCGLRAGLDEKVLPGLYFSTLRDLWESHWAFLGASLFVRVLCSFSRLQLWGFGRSPQR